MTVSEIISSIKETTKPTNKRRKRKGSQAATGQSLSKKGVSPRPTFSLASQDVMVVGEPSLMGGEFGEEDERLITRLENSQYDPSLGHAPPSLEDSYNGGGAPLPPPWARGSIVQPLPPSSQELDIKRSPPSSI